MTPYNDADHSAGRERPPVTPESAPRQVSRICGGGTCPTVYSTDGDTVLVQGRASARVPVLEGEQLVEVPRELILEAARRLQAQDD